MPANFDNQLPIDGNGHILPSGDLDRTFGWPFGSVGNGPATALRNPPAGQLEIYVWVVQAPIGGAAALADKGGMGAFVWCKGEPEPNNANKWKTVPGTVTSDGQFQNG